MGKAAPRRKRKQRNAGHDARSTAIISKSSSSDGLSPETNDSARPSKVHFPVPPGTVYTVKEHPIYPAGWRQKIMMTSVVVIPFLGVIGAIVWCWQYGFMGWPYLAMLFGGWAATGMGITIGYHRLATHRSFDTYEWMRAIWISLGSLALEGSPIDWCAIHRKHHELSDMPGDPHSPHLHGDSFWQQLKGFWYAHTGWLLTGHWHSPDLRRYVPDLTSKKWLVAYDKLYYLWAAASVLLPAVLGFVLSGGSWKVTLLSFIWGGLVRIFVTHHITWSINSICHIFGAKHFKAGDDSRNNPIFGFLAWGEGWHNNHHAFPTSARHGLLWWQFDTSYLVIRAMEMVGLAWNVRVPTARQMEARRNY